MQQCQLTRGGQGPRCSAVCTGAQGRGGASSEASAGWPLPRALPGAQRAAALPGARQWSGHALPTRTAAPLFSSPGHVVRSRTQPPARRSERLGQYCCCASAALEGGARVVPGRMDLLMLLAVPLGLVFLISGFTINLFQLLTLLLLRPFSKKYWRIVNRGAVELLWAQLVWLADWWGGVEMRLYVDKETFAKMGREHAIAVGNHRSDADWLVGWLVAQRVGALGGAKAVMKQSAAWVPALGWSMWMMEFIFLKRNWAKDKDTLERGYARLAGYPRPFWMTLFVEGTRFTRSKLEAAQSYARQAGLPVPKHTLVPKTKGFVSAVQQLRGFVPAIYDVTFAIPPGSDSPTFAGFLHRQKSKVHVRVVRHEMSSLPPDDEGVAKWCRELFQSKDALLEQHAQAGSFDEALYQPTRRPLFPLLVILGWTSLIGSATLKLLIWARAADKLTWTTVGIVMGVFVVVGIIMDAMIRFTQSEVRKPAEEKKVK